MIEVLTKALWVSAIAYLLYLIGKWIYIKIIKNNEDPFFYFIKVEKADEKAFLLDVESPKEDLDIEIQLIQGSTILYHKNAQLKLGINTISIVLLKELEEADTVLRIKSESQCLDRKWGPF
jgi:hypothetical protein